MAKASTFWERQSKAKAESNGQPDVGSILPDLAETMPNVREFLIGGLVAGVWVKGGTIAFAVDDRGPTCRVQDRSNGLVVWIGGNTWSALMKALDEGLGAGTLKWAKDKYSRTGKQAG